MKLQTHPLMSPSLLRENPELGEEIDPMMIGLGVAAVVGMGAFYWYFVVKPASELGEELGKAAGLTSKPPTPTSASRRSTSSSSSVVKPMDISGTKKVAQQFPTGSKVKVEWNGTWWDARVEAYNPHEAGYAIRYDYDNSEEYVPASRVKAVSSGWFGGEDWGALGKPEYL